MAGPVGQKPIDEAGAAAQFQAPKQVNQVGKLSTGAQVKRILLAPFKAIYDVFVAIGSFFSKTSEPQATRPTSYSAASPPSATSAKTTKIGSTIILGQSGESQERTSLTGAERKILQDIQGFGKDKWIKIETYKKLLSHPGLESQLRAAAPFLLEHLDFLKESAPLEGFIPETEPMSETQLKQFTEQLDGVASKFIQKKADQFINISDRLSRDILEAHKLFVDNSNSETASAVMKLLKKAQGQSVMMLSDPSNLPASPIIKELFAKI